MRLFDVEPPYLLEAIYPQFFREPSAEESRFRHVLLPAGHAAQSVRLWIERVIDEFKIAPSAWAKRAGLAPSTVNKFRENLSARNLSANTIHKLSEALKPEIAKIYADIDGFSTDIDPQFFAEQWFNEALLIGELGLEIPKGNESQTQGFPLMTVPVQAIFSRQNLAALVIKTEMHSPEYRMNDYVVGVPICRAGVDIPVGSDVVFHERIDGNRFNATIRRYLQDPSGHSWLVPVGEQAQKNTISVPEIGLRPKGSATLLIVGHYRALMIAQKSA